jgi:hypothetical protein
MPFLLVLLVVNAFILLYPALLVCAVFWGTIDEQWLMRTVFPVVLPLTVWMWYLILRFWRRSHELSKKG